VSTVRDVVMQLLRELEMTTVFGNPGSTELPMFRNFPSDFRYVLGLQEGVVVAMADGYAQARRKPALVNLHSAAGVGHSLGNLFTASRNHAPIVVTAGQQARSMLGNEPFLYAKDAARFPEPYIKWGVEPARAEDVPGAIATACHIAVQPPQGPTFVSIPIDDWDRACEPVSVRGVNTTIRAPDSQIAATAGAMNNAENPVLVVGAGVARDDAWDGTITLAERFQTPVWVSPMSGRNSFPEDHPLFAGFLPASREGIVAALEGADLILVLGAPVFTYHVEGHGPAIPDGAALVQLTDDASAAARAAVGSSILTNLSTGVADLLAATEGMARTAKPRLLRRDSVSPGRLTDAYLMQQIAKLRPQQSVIVEEAPSSRGAMHEHLPIVARDGFYTCASGGLGYSLPAAIGIALARPREKVIALLGDGSSMYTIQGLWTAARLDLPITFIIVNNGGYRALEGFAERFGIQAPPGIEIPRLDFVGLAEAQGVAGQRVDSPATLDEALAGAFASPSPQLVEVAIDY
jgi:benzoylformate decarboxylase